jgi:hypothetical protein
VTRDRTTEDERGTRIRRRSERQGVADWLLAAHSESAPGLASACRRSNGKPLATNDSCTSSFESLTSSCRPMTRAATRMMQARACRCRPCRRHGVSSLRWIWLPRRCDCTTMHARCEHRSLPTKLLVGYRRSVSSVVAGQQEDSCCALRRLTVGRVWFGFPSHKKRSGDVRSEVHLRGSVPLDQTIDGELLASSWSFSSVPTAHQERAGVTPPRKGSGLL